ncbi:MAG: prepilin-type N-terminal cleavage/methylation domain-containing protein, partial [Candidatus Izemoplasmatales bacterium]
MRKLLKNKRGVTLVELIAVLVILGIIAAIAIPTIGNLIDNQREKAAEAEWSNIEEAARLYATSEEPDNPFSLQDMIDEGYISNFDSTFTDAATDPDADPDPGIDLIENDIFDIDG